VGNKFLYEATKVAKGHGEHCTVISSCYYLNAAMSLGVSVSSLCCALFRVRAGCYIRVLLVQFFVW
jgi:hypothetical protein